MTLSAKLRAAAQHPENYRAALLLIEAAFAIEAADTALTLADKAIAERAEFDREQAEREAWERLGDERWTVADAEPLTTAEVLVRDVIEETLTRR